MSDNYKKYVSGYSEAGCKYDVPTREFFENTIPLVKCYQFENKVILKDNPTKVNEYPLNDEYELRANSNNYDLQVNGHSVKLPTDYFSDRKRYIRFKFKEIKEDNLLHWNLYCWIDGNETIIPFFRLKIEDVTFINFDEVYKVNHNFEGVAYIEKGESAKITGATASVDGTIGIPSVNVTSGGTALERSFNFSFSGLKGEKGDKGEPGGFANITQELGSQADYVISQKVVTDSLNLKANKADVYTKSEVNNSLNLKVNKSDIVNTDVGMSTVYPMTQSAVKNNFWHTVPIDNEVGPSKPAVSNRLFRTGLYVTVPTNNPAIPAAWDSNYDPCPGGTGYGTLLNLVNNGAAGIYRQQAQFYFADEPKNIYWRFDLNGQNHSDTSNWGTWKRLVSSDELNLKQDKASAFPYLALNGGLITKPASGLGWGTQTGSPIVGYGDSSDGGIMLRKDCPSAGKMSLIIDGKIYIDEGTNEVLGKSAVNNAGLIDGSNNGCFKIHRLSSTGYGMTILTGERYFSAGLQNWTLPETMRGTSYRILLTPCNSNSGSSYSIPNIYNKTTTSCYAYATNSITYSYLIIETW